jgi:decaprenylphospho-beta-D-erythro-pentofuranosid-2-ulose 2-reductase
VIPESVLHYHADLWEVKLNNKKRIAIIGATSAIAEHCARQWAKQNDIEFILIGRNIQRLESVAADLEVRNPLISVKIQETSLLEPEAIKKLVDALFDEGAISIALIAHGFLPKQKDCEEDLILCKEALDVNGVSPVLYAEAFAHHMSKIKRGTIAIISSVAGDRGRKSNYVYGAAKGLVTRYAQGLQHRMSGKGVQVTLIKPGPTATPMTAGMKGKFASVEEVANLIITGISQKKAVIYAPSKWLLVMMVLRLIPNFIFNKINI